ncbi:DsbA family protein [Halococcus qingdaonensis]|uniref:DsbA family protein n=1 Tax=Halococcus qingdaonensis TaxID=224402 RepID=UPI002115D96F|nr:thioredoxin domain-containing protein [Halococcus qingdaonensis]
MNPDRDSPASPGLSHIDRRRALLGIGGLTASTLAGCLGGASSGSNGSGGSGDTLPTPVQGDPEASTTVTVFEDFACPHCQTYVLDVLPTIASQYIDPGKIRYEHYDFPVVNDTSWRAASAARAVQKRTGAKQFFKYATALYENQSSLGPETYASLAKEMDLDGSAIRKAAENQAHESTVSANKQTGKDRGVQGTPTVFVGEETVDPTVEAISSAIESA